MDEDTTHQCHFCGTWIDEGLDHDYNAFDDEGNRKRHWLSDCRPDLVEHEIGPLCTWPMLVWDESLRSTPSEIDELNKKLDRPGCYAYMDSDTHIFGTDHIHFNTDGPM